jgi:hypothetical protein
VAFDGSGEDDPLPPRSPTGRVPQWVLDDAARRALPPVPARRRGGRALGFVALVLAVVLGAGVLLGPHLGRWTQVGAGPAVPGIPRPGALHDAPRTQPTTAPLDRPTPGHEEARAPRGHPLPPAAGGGPYAFLERQADGVSPVAYDPCRPIHYVVHPGGEPAGGAAVPAAAIARVSQVTGLQFVDDGATDEASTRHREIFQPARYGDRWAPVLFAWESDAANPDLAGEIVGEGGSTAVALGDGPKVFVTGTVSLDAGQFPQILRRRHGAAIARAIVMHELGHLVGLDHVDDTHQLMYPTSNGDVLDYAAGDLTGLAALGAGRCVPAL